MAISKLKPRHASEGRSIAAALKDRLDYDKNPEKTDGGLLVTGRFYHLVDKYVNLRHNINESHGDAKIEEQRRGDHCESNRYRQKGG